MLAKKGITYASDKWGEGGVFQAYQAGRTGTQGDYYGEAARGLRQLEKRRTDMLKRKEEGKDISEKNLGDVTREIAKRRGVNIFNPNEMKALEEDLDDEIIKETFIDGPIKGLIDDKNVPDPSAINIAKAKIGMPEHLGLGFDDKAVSGPVTTAKASPVWNPGIAAQEAAEKQAAFDRAVAENAAKAAAEAAAQRAYAARVPDRIYGGGNDGNQGGSGQAAADAAGGSAYSSPFKKGGRIDKALGGRSRDI